MLLALIANWLRSCATTNSAALRLLPRPLPVAEP
jgi:hypothetical protein